MKRLIIFLIRKRLGLKKYQHFKFSNQKSDTFYYFEETALIKGEKSPHLKLSYSNVPLNWLLNDECKVKAL